MEKISKQTVLPSFREWIALAMIVLSVGLLITLSVIGFGIIKQVETTTEKFKDIQAIFGMLLPLIGTWIGTVLAYYFSKENFVAANQSVNELVKHITSVEEKFHEIKVTDVMLKPENFPYRITDTLDAFEKFKIQDLVDEMKAKNVERLPILMKDSLKFAFLFYRSTLERFQIGFINGTIKLVNPKKSAKIDDLTVKDMFDSDYQLIKDVRELTKKKKFLSTDATLEDVRALMLDNVICQDVFITQSGDKEEKVEGWITNDLVIEKAEVFKKTRGV